jgi:hypothetical protein
LPIAVENRPTRRLQSDVAALIVLRGAQELFAVQDLQGPQAQEEHGEHGDREHPEDSDPNCELGREAVRLLDPRVGGKKAP